MKLFFWNTRGCNIDNHLISVLNENGIDIFVLAEFNEENSNFVKLINNEEEHFECVPQIGCKRISIICRTNMLDIEHGPESSYYTIKKIKLKNNFVFLMVAVHLPSKLKQNSLTQTLEATEFMKEIEFAEKELQTDNTFIVGDFNMNPFEYGMISASAFHSVPCKKIAGSRSRIIKNREHKFFYNPMWNLFGDIDDNPGTYFHRDSEQAVYFWNILDQVILRPSLIKYFQLEELKILKKIAQISLVSEDSRPNISDHLPIVFKFNFEGDFEDEEFVA